MDDLIQEMIEIAETVLRSSVEGYKLSQEMDSKRQDQIKYVRNHKIRMRRTLHQIEEDPEGWTDALKRESDTRTLCDLKSEIKNEAKKDEDLEKEVQKSRLEMWNDTLSRIEGYIAEDEEILHDRSTPEAVKQAFRKALEVHKQIVADTKRQISELEIEDAGRKGEESVEYVIKWMYPHGYKSIIKDCLSKYGNASIILKNGNYINEAQEFDHIIIGKNGIFLIETKNYSGTVTVNAGGDWVQEKNGTRKGIRNPVQQCCRHSAVMRSIVGDVPITSIICIANDGVIIEGRENCTIPIVKVELLQNFIEHINAGEFLTENQIQEIMKKINSHKVSKPLLED